MFGDLWIGGGNLLRCEFDVPDDVEFAQLKICPLGWGKWYLNAVEGDSQFFFPPQSNYDKRVFFQEYDVRPMLKTGRNVIVVALGEGFWAQSCIQNACGWTQPYGEVCCAIDLALSCRQETIHPLESIVSWQAGCGGHIFNNVYWGETFDATQEDHEWLSLPADAGKWHPAVVCSGPKGTLLRQNIPPEKIIRRLSPVARWQTAENEWIYDFGENIAGITELQLDAPYGTRVTLEFAEELDDKGNFDPASTGVFATGKIATDTYICRGGGVETWHPDFTYHGFRYVRVRNWELLRLTALEIHTDLKRVSSFQTSDELLTRLQKMMDLTFCGNFHALPTDCPAREKCGWLGDAQVTAEYGIYNYDLHDLYRKYLDDISTSSVDGVPTMIAPGKRTGGVASPAWGTAIIDLPWYLYLYYDDLEVLERHYSLMSSWLEYLKSRAENGIISYGNGDWCPPGTVRPVETPVFLTSTLYYYHDADKLAKIAEILGMNADADKYRNLAARIARAFNERCYDPFNHTYGSQTANALALYWNLVSPDEVSPVVHSLIDDIAKHENHFTSGILGLRVIFEVLSRYGYVDLAYAMIHASDYPGFSSLIAQDATTFWETWEKNPADEPPPRSRNHPMLGGFLAFFYKVLAGVNAMEDFPGWRKIDFRPCFPAQLDRIDFRFACSRGYIGSRWQRDRRLGIIKLELSIPESSEYILTLPENCILQRRESDLNNREICCWIRDLRLSGENTPGCNNNESV